MALFTQNINLKKPEPNDFYRIEDFNDNADIIDAEFEKRAKLPQNITNGNLVLLGSDGTLENSGKKVSDFMLSSVDYSDLGAEKSGEASKVNTQLNLHTGDSSVHVTQELREKIAKMHTTESIVISASQPPLIEGTVWIKVD